ncbi:hypothetical protein [Leucobacter manosquensis]|uniref:Uncharacterized protein n=1 Tax=Leucobacter manosquensis TaxID=2810611 RepID=A0ABS5M0I4_9MICO|nr:hypothetical protein [Leucobacter manosquensis]MBS3180689.1 hypothetical protein [Leucobacter manosquensis]
MSAYASPGVSEKWMWQGYYRHFEREHPEQISVVFPDGQPFASGALGAKLFLTEHVLSTTGDIHYLVRDLRIRLNDQLYFDRPEQVCAAFERFQAVVLAYYDGLLDRPLLDFYRDEMQTAWLDLPCSSCGGNV